MWNRSLTKSTFRPIAACHLRLFGNGPIWRSVKVTAVGQGVAVKAKAEQHQLATDEPVKLGGKDEAATPLHTLLVALMGCETATAHYAAKKLQISFDSIAFDIEGFYDVRGLKGEGAIPARFQRVSGTALVVTSGSQQDVDRLKAQTLRTCPVASLFIDAGVAMEVDWKKAC